MYESFLGVNPWTALLTLLNTLLVFFVAKKYLFGPVMGIITARQQEIAGLYAHADHVKAEADALRAEYQEKLSQAHTESERIIKEATLRGQAREEEILRKANADAAHILDKASARIAQERKKAMNEAKSEISEIVIAIAGKVMRRALTPADQSRLVDECIDDLGDPL